MTKQSKRPDKYAKHKMAAIPVLLAVLGYALLGGGETEPADSDLAASTRSGAPPAESTPSSPRPADAPPAAWPEVSVEEVLRGNPFTSYRFADEITPDAALVKALQGGNSVLTSLPPTTTAEGRADETAVARSLATGRVDYYFRSGRRNIVRIDGRLLEPGTPVSERARVESVSDGKLILRIRPADPQPID